MRASAEPASRRDWQEIFALLDTALELDSIQLTAWLEALPAEHARLSPMLKALLQAHAGVGHRRLHAGASNIRPARLSRRHRGRPLNRSSARIGCCARLAKAAWRASGWQIDPMVSSSVRSR